MNGTYVANPNEYGKRERLCRRNDVHLTSLRCDGLVPRPILHHKRPAYYFAFLISDGFPLVHIEAIDRCLVVVWKRKAKRCSKMQGIPEAIYRTEVLLYKAHPSLLNRQWRNMRLLRARV